MSYVRTIWFVTFLLQAFWLGAAAAGPKPPDEAFRFDVTQGEEEGVELLWSIEPGYYLYRDRIAASLGGKPLKVATTRGETKDDPTFGSTEVYHHEATALIDALPETGELRVTYQGCGENTICYPPITKVIDLATLIVRDADAREDGMHSLSSSAAEEPGPAVPGEFSPAGATTPDLGGSLASTLFAFLGFGVLLAFTPCVLPMVPILSGMLTRSAEKLSPGRGFLLSATYVLAMAGAYGVLGIFAAWFGGNLQATLQTPVAVGLMSLMFVVLALSMFGFYELQVPHAWSARLTFGAGRAGSIGGAALLGFTSALIVGPCVTPPLAAALVYIAQTGNATRGSAALFSLGLGMGLPLLAFGTFGATALPKSGPWLVRVKQAFGIVFIGVAIWMMSRILPLPSIAFAWGAFAVGIALWLGWPEPGRARSARHWGRVASAMAAGALAIYGGLVAVGGITGWYAPLQPFAWAGVTLPIAAPGLEADGFQTVTNEGDLDAAIAAAGAEGRPVLIDFSAEWCTECRLMERTVFADEAVRQRLSALRLIRADMTRYDLASKKLMERFAVVGPPTLVFLNTMGREVDGTRMIGTTAVHDLLDKIAVAERG
ncbi:protein-disulfide reductase DsbD [Bradyrhizobium sp. CCBAU 53338]|uniref:protein-disulfide reductase DsbD n=1 Tax=Bradyrhizobium sp. CCBAU 53338 TaxID=1325111 RepID=UPI001AEDEC32|nr:protein-disulfide reductase DsbD [Bradyrhizobium sp. CCBAU 53338]